MPPHSSHILQPLDVSCFAVLKRVYGRLVEANMRMGINHINKLDFQALYREARTTTFTQNNINSGFMATGLVPFNPDRVLSKLHVLMRTPSPSAQFMPTLVEQRWEPETPHNTAELQLQTEAIKTLIRYRTQSPPSPTVRAVNQLIKGCEMAMHSSILLAIENKDLRAANEKVKKKRGIKRSYVGRGRVLTSAEVQETQNQTVISPEVPNVVVQSLETRVIIRASRLCSICRSPDHTARTCSER